MVTIDQKLEQFKNKKIAVLGLGVSNRPLVRLLLEAGCSHVAWLFPEETGFYQPIVIARK